MATVQQPGGSPKLGGSPTVQKVLVTGAGGFIGMHTVLHLLQQGYQVRGTVRTEVHGEKVRETLAKHTPVSQLELACADLEKDAGWKEAVQGCDGVFHIASPYPSSNPKDENELLVPARDGTLRVLRAAQSGGVRRVVMLSSVIAIFEGHQGENRIFTEKDWTDLKKTNSTYGKSKTMAEQAAWTFIHGAENTAKMELVTINPPNVFGPVLDNHVHTSTEWYRAMLHHAVPGIPNLQMDLVDVRDLVDILRKALITPAAAGNRYICSSASIHMREFAQILAQNFSARGYRVPTGSIPDWVFKGIGLLLPEARGLAGGLGWCYTLSTQALVSTFGWQPIPYQQTILEMAESLVAQGIV
jgi:dihydroflavonol-4-reductase